MNEYFNQEGGERGVSEEKLIGPDKLDIGAGSTARRVEIHKHHETG
jgi:hypothetical protein